MIDFEEYRKNKPFWYRVKDTLEDWLIPGWYYRLKYKIFDIYYGLKNKCHWVYTGLPLQSWYDIDTRMLHANMHLLVEYVEEEKGIENTCWDESPWKEARAEIDIIYAWWKNYPNRQKEIDDTLDKWADLEKAATHKYLVPDSDDKKKIMLYELKSDVLNADKKKEADEMHAKLTKMEEDLIAEENDMLCRLVKIRGFLWT